MSTQIIANLIAASAPLASVAAIFFARRDQSAAARSADKAELKKRIDAIEKEARAGREKIYSVLEDVKRDLHDLKVKVAERYVRRQDFDALDTLFRSRLDALKGLLERPETRG